MIDPRFYEALGPVTVRALAPSAEIGGDPETRITGAASADRAGPHDLCYYEGKVGAPLTGAPGACVITPPAAHLAPQAKALILTDHPRAMFARLVSKLARPRGFAGPHAIDPGAKVEPGARIAPGAVIGPGAEIGADAEIGANAVIGPGVAIGRRTRIGAGASVFFALVGDGVNVLAGARIGETGFGVAGGGGGPVDMPHLGRVVIQDRATIGANTTIDRGVFDDTTIGEDAKIDNLCQIAHNVTIGRGALIAAFGGISGSTVIGDGAMMGGRVGVTDHRVVGPRAVLAAGSAVLQDVPAGETWAGYPAKPIRRWMREAAWLSRKVGARNGE
ncbi:MAG TPA: UDP-3-O-(3-hydroxymyristoyl)glucosamine N-acyltransferase [Caulobacterales bacterium]|nr:UDP-3-O-(3-hydroxymyristoyl)glucosamine N-acyltransferase [Caulobacterales bacterium]